MPAPAFSCDDELEEKVLAYIEQTDGPLTKEGFCLFAGISEHTLAPYRTGKYDDDSIEGFSFSRHIRTLETAIKERLMRCALTGEYKEGMAKFLLQARHGFRTGEEAQHVAPQAINFHFNVQGVTQEETPVLDVPLPKINVVNG